MAGEVFGNNEVRAGRSLYGKSEPVYSEDGRKHRTVRTVLLEVVFGENGYVTGTKVIRGLPHGLNESAIEAARNIRSFAAMKDGLPVSLLLKLEYNFNLK